MALLFQQTALNFAKNGYYPTDSETMAQILSMLSPCAEGQMRILDPCAGEGAALAECKQHLDASRIQAFGIEYDEERAWHAKDLLDRCIHADMQNCVIGKRSFGLLFLNPPYGDLLADKAQTGSFTQEGRKRLEKLFYQLTMPALQLGGILALIIPVYSLDKELAHWISHNFDKVEVFTAPEQRFKQIVLFGIRIPANTTRGQAQSENISNIKAVKSRLIKIGSGEIFAPEFPSCRDKAMPCLYTVPAAPQTDVRFFSSRLDAKQLAVEINGQSCLWHQFQEKFGNVVQTTRRPLMPLSDWHLALSLAAGQVSGVVHSHDGRIFVIRGDTHKEVQITKSYEQNDKDDFIEVTTHLDKFVPVIRAVDMTPQSSTFGEVLTIR